MSSSSQLDSTLRGRGLSLRAISLISLVVFGLLVFGLAAGLLITSRFVWRATEKVELDTQAISLTEEIDQTLREHSRLGNLWVATLEHQVDVTRSALESDMRRLLIEIQGHPSTSAEEARLVATLSGDVSAYLAERAALEAAGLPLDEIVRRLRPAIDRALTSSSSLRRVNQENLSQTKLAADRALRFQYDLVLVAAVVTVIGLALVSLGVRWLVVQPVLDLAAVVRRFQAGDTEAKAKDGPLREMRHLAAAFNEMVDTITGARRDQLTFLAAVAHDLRNPLSGLKILVQSLERAPTAATPERFRRLDRQLDRLARMVGDLLDATRIESGQLELRLEDFDLRDTARAMVDLYAPTTTTHEVILKVPEEPVIIHADPLRIEQILSNLLSNAIKYSPGGGRVEVLVKAVDGQAELSVSDRGVGIPAEDFPSLFQPFRRRPSTAAIPGIGLGLSSVRRIVQAHGGHIEVESEPDAGSTFRVWLEAREGGEVERRLAGAQPEPPRPEPR